MKTIIRPKSRKKRIQKKYIKKLALRLWLLRHKNLWKCKEISRKEYEKRGNTIRPTFKYWMQVTQNSYWMINITV